MPAPQGWMADQVATDSSSKEIIYTEYKNLNNLPDGISIENSFPKGGGRLDGAPGYTDATGRSHAYVVFWTRITNNSTTPIRLEIEFPADSLPIFTAPDAYLKLFLPPDTLREEMLPSYNYGISGLRSFLDEHFWTATQLGIEIPAGGRHIFYVAALSYRASGTCRAEFVLEGSELMYRVNIAPHGGGAVPCGEIKAVRD